MKIRFLLLLLFVISLNAVAQYTDRQLIINTTGNGFSRTTFNGVDAEKWDYIQKFTNLTYNGQDASVTAVRLHVTWVHYEPTLGDYQRTKIVQAVQAITALKPGLKVALHFPYQRDGRIIEQYFGDEDMSRTSNGTLVGQDVGWSNPSIFSAVGKQRFYAFVDDVLAQLAANSLMDKILYVEMGNGSAEEFANPYITINGQLHIGSYEDKAVQAWRTEYLPCRYPGQSTVTWNGNTHNIATAPVATNPYGDWPSEHQKEYHRFIGWGLMNFYKGFRDVVKNRNSNLKVVYFISDFGTQQGNQYFLHNSTLPMAMQEFDGIYTSDGTSIWDLDRKIMPIDVIKGTNPNKIAAIEFDQEDLGQPNPPYPNAPINANLTAEWMERAYKHGVNHINLAMWFNDAQIEQLKPVFANIRATYLNPSYTAPARQTSITQNVFPHVFGATSLFSSWSSNGGANWSSSDNNPVSINMIDDGYWENIWSCSSNPDPCLFTVGASASNSSPQTNTSVTLTSSCTGQCTGVTYSWSGNGISGSGSSVTFNAPGTPGTYTYTVTASKSGCSNKTATVQLTVGGACDFNISASASPSSVAASGSVALSYNCTGTNCSGVSYAWSGQGISGSSSPLNITAPGSAGSYTYTVTASKSGCSDKTATTTIAVTGGGENPCNYVDKQTVGTWSGLNVQTRKYTVNSVDTWLIVTAVSGSPTDKHFPRGKNFADRGDISWTNGVINKTCLGGGDTDWGGLTIPSNITVPSGYTQGAEQDGAVYFEQSCTAPSAPSLSASPATITSGNSSTLSASGCSGGTITWSDGLGTGTSKSVSPTSTKTYTATCSISGCTSSNGSVTVTVNPPSGGPNCGSVAGHFDGANCHFIEGWAYDASNPNTVINVDIYSGATLIQANVPANKFRQDLLNANIGNGVHGLEIATPSALKDGQTHYVTVKVSGCSFELINSPRAISSCSNAIIAGAEGDIISSQHNQKLQISPNPNNGLFNASFYIPKGKKATLVVNDIQGRTLFIKNYNGSGLINNEKINLLGKSSGTIFIQLRKEDGVEVKKVNITR